MTIFWSERGLGFGEPGGTGTPTKNSQEYPPPPPPPPQPPRAPPPPPPGLHHSKFADYIIFVRKAEMQYALFTIEKDKICCKHYSAT